MLMKLQRLVLPALLLLSLPACSAAVAVVDAAATTVSTAVDVTSSVVETTVDTVTGDDE